MNVIITGASRGIGFETAKRFISAPENKIIAIARNKEMLEKLKKLEPERSSELVIIPFDLVKSSIKNELKPQILNYFKTIDILINNAGFLVKKPLSEIQDQDFDNMFDVNIKAVFKLIQSLLSHFNQNAHILNISSMGGFQGSAKFPGLALYSASKAALAVFSECIAEELKDRNIKSNCLCIGAAETDMLKEAFPGYKAPLTAEEISEFIYDFAIKGHRFINGKILPVSLSTP